MEVLELKTEPVRRFNILKCQIITIMVNCGSLLLKRTRTQATLASIFIFWFASKFDRHRAARVFLRLGPAEVGFTQNISAGGASIILTEIPRAHILRVDFANNVVSYTLILRLFWKLPAGRLTESGGALTGRR